MRKLIFSDGEYSIYDQIESISITVTASNHNTWTNTQNQNTITPQIQIMSSFWGGEVAKKAMDQDTITFDIPISGKTNELWLNPYGFDPSAGQIDFSYTLNITPSSGESKYFTAVKLIENSTSVVGTDFSDSTTNIPWNSCAINDTCDEWQLYSKAVRADGARFVMKYTVSQSSWFNMFTPSFDNIGLHDCADSAAFINVINGKRQIEGNYWEFPSYVGEHVLYYSCADYISAINNHTCGENSLNHKAGDLSFDNSKGIYFQSDTKVEITDLYVEVPVGTDLTLPPKDADFDGELQLQVNDNFSPSLKVYKYNTDYTLKYEGSGDLGGGYNWLFIKGMGNDIWASGITDNSILRVKSVVIDGGEPLKFKDNAESVEYVVGTNYNNGAYNSHTAGRVEYALHMGIFGTNVFADGEINKHFNSSVEVTFEIVDPNPEPEGIPMTFKYGYWSTEEIDLFDAGEDSEGKPIIERYSTNIGELLEKYKTAEITFTVTAINGDKAASADVKDAYVSIIGSAGGDNGWLDKADSFTYINEDGKVTVTVDLEKLFGSVESHNVFNEIKLYIRMPGEDPLDASAKIYAVLDGEPTLKLIEKTTEPAPEPSDCPNGNDHTEEGWVKVEPSAVTTNNSENPTTWYVPIDNVYVGDTIDVCVSGTAEGNNRIRFYIANGAGGSSNNITSSDANITDITEGAFKFDVKSAVTSDINTGVKMGNYIWFLAPRGETALTNIEFTHIYYRIHHEHTLGGKAYDGKYHWDACTVCGEPTGEKTEHTYTDGALKCDGCDFTHLENELEVEITNSTVKDTNGSALRVEDGAIIIEGGVDNEQYGIKLPAALEAGKDYTFHIVFESKGNVRFRTTPDGVDGGSNQWKEYLSAGTYDVKDMTITPAENDGYLEIKASIGQKLDYAKITHIGVVYPEHEHNYDGYEYDLTTHWRKCTICGEVEEPEPHDPASATPGVACKCGFMHPADEVAIDLKAAAAVGRENITFDDDGNASVKDNDVGTISFALDRNLNLGEEVTFHILASGYGDARMWLMVGTGQTRISDIHYMNQQTLNGNLYDFTVTIKVEDKENNGSTTAGSIAFKGATSSTNLRAMTIYHIGVVYPGCDHPADRRVTQFDLDNHWERCLDCNEIIADSTKPHTMEGNKCTGCAFEHYPNEVEIELTAENINADAMDSVTIENGVVKVAANSAEWLNFKIGRYLMNGETVSVHVIGEIIGGSANGNGYLRAWLGDTTNKSLGTECLDINKTADGTFYNGYFQIKKEFTHQYDQDAARTFALKANSYDTTLPELVIEHVAVVVPECPHNETSPKHQEWLDGNYTKYNQASLVPGKFNCHDLVCTLCGEIIETVQHAPNEDGCTDIGDGEFHIYTCVCGNEITATHREGTEYGNSATEHWSLCADCGGRIDRTVEAHKFSYKDNEDGETHTVACDTCEYVNESESHSWDNGTVHEATETEVGYTLYTCTLCKATKRVDLEHVHNGGDVWLTDETSHWHKCTLAGCPAEGGIYGKVEHEYKDGVCTVCKYAHKEHTPAEGSYKNVSADEHSYTCSVCGATVTEAHTAGEQAHDESTHWNTCTKCDAHLDETEHNLTREPIEGDSDKHTLKCTDCDYTATESHSWDNGTVHEATETEVGYTLYTCTLCKATKRVDFEHVHNGGDVWLTDETSHWHKCTLAGCPAEGGIYGKVEHEYKDGVCTVCEYAHKEHTPAEGSYKNNGADEHSYTCSVCGATVTEAHDTVKQGDASGHHDYCAKCGYEGETEAHAEGSYTDNGDGTHKVNCAECGYTAESEKHTPGSDFTEDDESRYHLCTKCGGKCDETAHTYEWVDKGNGQHDYECSECGHVQTGSLEDHTYVNGVCSKCGYTHPEAEHSWGDGWTPDLGGTTHSRTCTVCNKTETKPHGYPESWTPAEGGKQHSKTCEDCGNTVTADHTFGGWTNVDTSAHKRSCECGYEETAPHSFEEGVYTIDNINHWQVCKDCAGTSAKENHKYPEGDDHCSVCDYWNHQHHIVMKHDDTTHWEECDVEGCDYRTDPEPHKLDETVDYDYNATQHSKSCTVCGAKVSEDHEFEEKYDSVGHWQQCKICKYETRLTVHTLTDAHDAASHWQKCDECAYETEHEAHAAGAEYGQSETQHWSICTECGATYNYAEHTLAKDLKHDAEGHWSYCEVCGKEETKSAHNWDSGVVTKEPTETAEGEKLYNCSECDETKTETIPKLKHTHVEGDEWKSDEKTHWHECVSETCDDKSVRLSEAEHIDDEGTVTKAATEAEEGVITYKCTVCGRVTRTEAIPKLKHTHVEGDEWKSDEKTHWHECVSETCDDKTVRLSEAEHIDDEGTVTKAATEAEEGVMTYKCTVCGRVTRTEAIPKLKHTHVEGEEWKSDEKTHWHECVSETCDDKSVRLSEAEHIDDEGTVTKAATEAEEGVMTYKCTVCGRVTRTETIPKLKHTHVEGEEWKSDEKTHWHECVSETCDDAGVRLSEAEHVWDDGKVTVEPTYTEEGEKLFTCEVCKATKTETIPVNAHDHETVMKSDANGHWYECTVCGEIVGEVEPHTPGEWITDSEATSSETGKRHKECTVCGYVTETLTVPATGNIDVEVPTVGNVPKVEIPAEQQEVLKDAVIDEEDVAAIENGASIDIALTVEDAEKTVDPEDKALIDAKTSEGEYRHVAYLDITLTKTVTDALGASTTEEISEISRPINIVIEVPYALSRTYRTFAVIRVHDGVAEVLSDLDSDPKTVTISTDLFSSYALVYTDGEHQQEGVGGLIGHAHIITDIRHDSEYHWRGCFLCSIRVDYAPHTFMDGVCPICGYVDPDYVSSEEVEDAEVSIEAPAEGTDQTGDSEGTPEITDTPAYLPENEAEVVEVKEDETSENPKTGVIFTGIGAVMAAIAALIAKRK